MVRLLDARGLPVVCLKGENRVGYLGEPIYNEDEEIRGFLIDGAKGIGRRYVDLEDILRIGKENCIIYSEASVQKLGRMKNLLRQKSSLTAVIGREAKDSSGRSIGIVRDLAFDMETGMIEGIELSRGFMEDLRDGRMLVCLQNGVELGEKNIIIKEESGL